MLYGIPNLKITCPFAIRMEMVEDSYPSSNIVEPRWLVPGDRGFLHGSISVFMGNLRGGSLNPEASDSRALKKQEDNRLSWETAMPPQVGWERTHDVWFLFGLSRTSNVVVYPISVEDPNKTITFAEPFPAGDFIKLDGKIIYPSFNGEYLFFNYGINSIMSEGGLSYQNSHLDKWHALQNSYNKGGDWAGHVTVTQYQIDENRNATNPVVLGKNITYEVSKGRYYPAHFTISHIYSCDKIVTTTTTIPPTTTKTTPLPTTTTPQPVQTTTRTTTPEPTTRSPKIFCDKRGVCLNF